MCEEMKLIKYTHLSIGYKLMKQKKKYKTWKKQKGKWKTKK